MPLTGLAIHSHPLSPSYTLHLRTPASLLLCLAPASWLLLLLDPGFWLQDFPSCPQPGRDPPVYLAVFGDSMGMEGGQAALVGDSIEESLKVKVAVVFIVSFLCSLGMVLTF